MVLLMKLVKNVVKISREFCIVDHREISTMKLCTVLKHLEAACPLHLAESWDNVGLLTAPSSEEEIDIGSVLFTNDLTEDVLQEAIACKANMIFSYHPPIFTPMKCLLSKSWKQKIILSCIENRIAIFSPHTSLDAVNGGVNDWLTSCFDLSSSKPVIPSAEVSSDSNSLISCAVNEKFNLKKITDIPRSTVSINSSTEAVKDLKIEVPSSSLPELMSLLSREGVMNMSLQRFQNSTSCGMGRIGELKNKITLKEAIHLTKQHLHLDLLRVSFGKEHSLDSLVSVIAVCAGSGAKVLLGADAQLYITGEMSHHELLDAAHRGVTVILCEHSNSERGYLKNIIDLLQPKLNGVQLILSKSDKDPVKIL